MFDDEYLGFENSEFENSDQITANEYYQSNQNPLSTHSQKKSSLPPLPTSSSSFFDFPVQSMYQENTNSYKIKSSDSLSGMSFDYQHSRPIDSNNYKSAIPPVLGLVLQPIIISGIITDGHTIEINTESSSRVTESDRIDTYDLITLFTNGSNDTMETTENGTTYNITETSVETSTEPTTPSETTDSPIASGTDSLDLAVTSGTDSLEPSIASVTDSLDLPSTSETDRIELPITSNTLLVIDDNVDGTNSSTTDAAEITAVNNQENTPTVADDSSMDLDKESEDVAVITALLTTLQPSNQKKPSARRLFTSGGRNTNNIQANEDTDIEELSIATTRGSNPGTSSLDRASTKTKITNLATLTTQVMAATKSYLPPVLTYTADTINVTESSMNV